MSTKTQEQLSFMDSFKKKVTDYLTDELNINIKALETYDEPIKDSDSEVRRLREMEAIKLRNNIKELRTHIAVIKKM